MKQNDLSMIGAMPLPAQWLSRVAAFQSADAAIVRASIHMLFAAFHGRPSGSIDKSVEAIAAAAQLPIEMVQDNLALLKMGYRETKTRLIFDPMADMAARLHTNHAGELQALHDKIVLQLVSPSLFDDTAPVEQQELVTIGGATADKVQNLLDRRSKAPSPLPYDATMTEAMKKHCERNGFEAERFDDLWQRFCDYAHRDNRTYTDWNASFRTWLNNAIRWGNIATPNATSSAANVNGKDVTLTPNFSRPRFAPASSRKEEAKEISRQRMIQSQAFVLGADK